MLRKVWVQATKNAMHHTNHLKDLLAGKLQQDPFNNQNNNNNNLTIFFCRRFEAAYL